MAQFLTDKPEQQEAFLRGIDRGLAFLDGDLSAAKPCAPAQDQPEQVGRLPTCWWLCYVCRPAGGSARLAGQSTVQFLRQGQLLQADGPAFVLPCTASEPQAQPELAQGQGCLVHDIPRMQAMDQPREAASTSVGPGEDDRDTQVMVEYPADSGMPPQGLSEGEGQEAEAATARFTTPVGPVHRGGPSQPPVQQRKQRRKPAAQVQADEPAPAEPQPGGQKEQKAEKKPRARRRAKAKPELSGTTPDAQPGVPYAGRPTPVHVSLQQPAAGSAAMWRAGSSADNDRSAAEQATPSGPVN